jgi:hypothetical protein
MNTPPIDAATLELLERQMASIALILLDQLGCGATSFSFPLDNGHRIGILVVMDDDVDKMKSWSRKEIFNTEGCKTKDVLADNGENDATAHP